MATATGWHRLARWGKIEQQLGLARVASAGGVCAQKLMPCDCRCSRSYPAAAEGFVDGGECSWQWLWFAEAAAAAW